MPLERNDIDGLIDAAKAVYGEFALSGGFSAGSCAAAIRSVRGDIFTGICLDLGCGIGFCAEHAAVAEMLKTRETGISAAVAVSGNVIVPPCGRCRELMAQLNPKNLDDAQIILDPDRVVPLRALLPEHWSPSAEA